MNVRSISVLICSYNRAALLRETLQAFDQVNAPDDCEVEIIVVDNNSSDDTPEVLGQIARTARFPLVRLRETRQGKSFALNLGLAHARGDVIALTDDDVLPGPEWLAHIVDAFRRHEALTFVFGKVLPRWGCVPPPELLTTRAQDIWGPLAIVDYGDEPVAYVAGSTGQRLPIGANLAFAKSALVAIGGWRTDLGKVNNTLISGEDHEIFVRLRRNGLYAGFYDPRISVRHYVPASRLTRRYFRQWFYWHGKTNALMLAELFPDLDLARVPCIAGVPRFIYRQAVGQFWRYARSAGRSDALTLLIEELKALQFLGLFSGCWARSRRRPLPGGSAAAAVAPGVPLR